jgi:hypothetical protein
MLAVMSPIAMKIESPPMSCVLSISSVPMGSIRNHFASAALSRTAKIPDPWSNKAEHRIMAGMNRRNGEPGM